MKKIFLSSLLCLSVWALAQNNGNLIPDGDFENSSNKWSFGKDYSSNRFVVSVVSSEGRSGSKCAKTIEYISDNIGRSSSWMRTKGLDISSGVSGGSFTISFWASPNIDVSKTSINVKVKKTVMVQPEEEGEEAYEDEQYKTIVIKNLTEKQTDSDWKQYSADFNVDEGWTNITEVRFDLMDQPNLKIDDIELRAATLPLQGLQVAENHPHEVKVSWTASEGVESYQVKVGNGEWKTTSNTYFWVTGLTPQTQYTITVKEKDTSKQAQVQVTTAQATEQDVIPYLWIENGAISKSFIPFIFDAEATPTITHVYLDGTEVTADEQGVYTLVEGEGKKLKLVVTIAGKTWTLEYIGLVVK